MFVSKSILYGDYAHCILDHLSHRTFTDSEKSIKADIATNYCRMAIQLLIDNAHHDETLSSSSSNSSSSLSISSSSTSNTVSVQCSPDQLNVSSRYAKLIPYHIDLAQLLYTTSDDHDEEALDILINALNIDDQLNIPHGHLEQYIKDDLLQSDLNSLLDNIVTYVHELESQGKQNLQQYVFSKVRCEEFKIGLCQRFNMPPLSPLAASQASSRASQLDRNKHSLSKVSSCLL